MKYMEEMKLPGQTRGILAIYHTWGSEIDPRRMFKGQLLSISVKKYLAFKIWTFFRSYCYYLLSEKLLLYGKFGPYCFEKQNKTEIIQHLPLQFHRKCSSASIWNCFSKLYFLHANNFIPPCLVMVSSIVKWGYQDNFKPVYFLRKSFERKKTLTSKKKINKIKLSKH